MPWCFVWEVCNWRNSENKYCQISANCCLSISVLSLLNERIRDYSVSGTTWTWSFTSIFEQNIFKTTREIPAINWCAGICTVVQSGNGTKFALILIITAFPDIEIIKSSPHNTTGHQSKLRKELEEKYFNEFFQEILKEGTAEM